MNLPRKVCLSLLGVTLLGGAMMKMNAAPPNKPASQDYTDPKYWAQQRIESRALSNDTWLNEKWTGNDAPYASLRNQINSAIATGTSPNELVAQYAPQAKRVPNNTLAQFAWAYTVWLQVKAIAFPQQQRLDLLRTVSVALALAPSPHTYNYDRMRYLIWLQFGGGAASHYLESMAYRLLAKAPQDFPVQLGLAAIYTQNEDRGQQKKGYAYIQQLIQGNPDKPEVYDMLGAWYYTQYLFYHAPENYRQAISYYQKAYTMYPVASARHAQLPHLIEMAEKRYHQISGN